MFFKSSISYEIVLLEKLKTWSVISWNLLLSFSNWSFKNYDLNVRDELKNLNLAKKLEAEREKQMK